MLSRSCACQPASLTGSRTTRTRPLRLHINSPRSRSRDVAAMAFPFSRKIAKLQQNFNSAGINLFLQIVGSNHSLALPHISVPDIRHVDWEALAAAGYKGCIFDKDNTICRPFALEVDAALQDSMDRCKAAFSGKIVLFSNSAGLEQYDPDGAEARELETAFGLTVLRHKEKKPAGSCTEAEQHFGCKASEMVMIGDRYLTDVVYGNRHGMLTVRVAPLTTEGEPYGVWAARAVEEYFVGRWSGAGEAGPVQELCADAQYSRFVRK